MSKTEGRGHDRLLLSSRLALIVGFGSLLAIMALAGIDALRVLQSFRTKDDRIRRQFLFRNHVLNDIRSEVYVSGTYVRDYLLEPETERAEAYRASLEQVRVQMVSALDSYGRQIAPEEVKHYTALKSELAQYWGILAPIFKWDAVERRRLGYTFLRDEVFPRRQNMLAIADRIAEINEQQLNAANDLVVGLLLAFQTRVAITLVAALALGLGMAAFSMRKILKLEQQAHARYEEAAEARSQLKDLSARLVQAQETERRALSRELHDEVGQSLSAVLIELRNLSTGLGIRSDDQLRTQVEIIKGLVESTVRVVRNMALLLRPSMLDDLGLVPALRWQAREVSKRTSMDVSVAADFVSDDLPDEYKTCIYRVVQEALHNSSRHAQANAVRIRVQQEPSRLTLSIQDDGQGFDVTQMKGLGLAGIQERVEQLGGICHVHSEPGAGTVLTVELPFKVTEQNGITNARETDSHPVS
ncbi:MAG TPA: ATP-binding protein [Bryobacteraceae bacterium]|jgi:signal transduction histidine kinase|nr:ATP-binding protein [Bryobacteraceae bacterium]